MIEGLTPEQEASARRYVLHRAVDEGWSRSEVWDMVRMLGFEPTTSGGYYNSLGRNVPLSERPASWRPQQDPGTVAIEE